MMLRRSPEWAYVPDEVKQKHDFCVKDDGEFWSVSCATLALVFLLSFAKQAVQS